MGAPANIEITVRRAGIHIPPDVESREAYEKLSPDAKFGVPVKPEELITLPKEKLTLWFRKVKRGSYCSHLQAASESKKRNIVWKCTSGTCYLLLVEDEHQSIEDAATPGRWWGKAWPRQWFGTGHGPLFQDDKMEEAEEYIKCIESDDFFDQKHDRHILTGHAFCACPTYLDCRYCECSPALKAERLKPEREIWRRREHEKWEKEIERRAAEGPVKMSEKAWFRAF